MRSCRTLVERNALGWSSTNAGGHLIVEDSTFRDNSVGVAPDSEPDDDLPPPQDGACNSGSNRARLPTFTSTQIDRCTIFRDNVIEDNGNISTPANSDILNAPWGEGLVLGGDYADLIEDNTIKDNPTFGVLVLERPDPFPPTSKTVYFQSSGNEVSDNTVTGNGSVSGTDDLALEGGVFGTQNSVNNCFSGNTFATSSPADLEGTWGCQNATTPNGGDALFAEILKLIGQSGARHQRPQPAPGPSPRCRGRAGECRRTRSARSPEWSSPPGRQEPALHVVTSGRRPRGGKNPLHTGPEWSRPAGAASGPNLVGSMAPVVVKLGSSFVADECGGVREEVLAGVRRARRLHRAGRRRWS